MYYREEAGKWRCEACGYQVEAEDDDDDEEYAHTTSPH